MPAITRQINLFHSRGLTLVEILVAMTLFSLVLTMIYGSMYSAGKSWQQSEARIEQNTDTRLELSFIKKQLAQAIPLIFLDGINNQVIFRGERDAIHFISILPSHRGGSGLNLLTINTTNYKDNKALTLTYRPLTSDLDMNNLEISEDDKSIILIENIEKIECSYYGSEQDLFDPLWFDEWVDEQRLPILAKIHLETSDAELYIPDIVVRLHNDTVRGQPQLIIYKGDSAEEQATEPEDQPGSRPDGPDHQAPVEEDNRAIRNQ